MHIGLVSVSFRAYTPSEILNACVKSKIPAIEWGSDIHARPEDTEGLKKISETQRALGITCSSYGTYFYIGKNKTEEILPYINAAKILGTDILRVWCGSKSFSKYKESEKKLLFDECKELAKIAEAHGVTLCTEFHSNTFTDCSEGVEELHNAVNSKHLKTYWQPNTHKEKAENISSAKKISYITENIHVFNWVGYDRYPLAEAVDAWREYFSHFSSAGYALLEFMPDDKIESLPAEADALRLIIGEKS